MAVTLKQIAGIVGVDVSVVSRVLNDKTGNYHFTEERMEQIRRTARELGYIPNIYAQAVKTGNFGCVALLLSSHGERSYLPNLLLDSMHKELEKRGKHLLLTKLPDANGDDYSQTPAILKTLMADGLIVDYTHHVSPGIISRIEKFILPKVWINTKRETDCVYPDNIKAGMEAANKLIKSGHKNIAYVTDVSYQPSKFGEHYSIPDRYEGYKIKMKKAGLEIRKFDGEGKVIPKNKQVDYFVNILSQPNRPTAMILYWSSLVPAVLGSARKLGINIPDELSLITFAGCVSRDAGLSINAMIEPEEEMGIESVKMLNRKIKKQKKLFISLPLSFSYFDTGSCKKLL
ncbi:LacI family DNA-binding transcriptional regulator [bacterium]|nr:LacI family DNA-binding transcriptional regulator [bacterium]